MWLLNGCNHIRVQHSSQETEKILRKFLELTAKPNVIYIVNSLEPGKACEDLSWNHVHQRTIDPKQMVLRSGQDAELEHPRYFCHLASMKMVDRFHGMLSAKRSRPLVG